MSAISVFAAAQAAFNARLNVSISGLTDDVAALNAKILELQNSAGTVTAEDQALLNELQAQAEAMTVKMEALDSLTPPVVPNSGGGTPPEGDK